MGGGIRSMKRIILKYSTYDSCVTGVRGVQREARGGGGVQPEATDRMCCD